MFTDDYRAAYPERVEAFFEHVYATHAKLPEYINLIIARHSWEATHRLGDVLRPTLVLIGDKDSGRSNHVAQAQAMQSRIPGAQFRTLPGQAHGFPWQAPELTNSTILEWVTAHA
jgi:pimeloyl-ACP methyl ester carboxylesterase